MTRRMSAFDPKETLGRLARPFDQGCQRAISHAKGDLANEPFGPPVKLRRALELPSHPLDCPSTEPSACRHLHYRTTNFGPAEDKLSIRAVLPFQLNLTLLPGQRAVLRGIGCQLMQGYGNGLSGIGLQED